MIETSQPSHPKAASSVVTTTTNTVMNFMGGITRVAQGTMSATASSTSNTANGISGNAPLAERETWSLGGKQFQFPVREIYSRSLYRICLKFTTSEDEDEGKLEPATAYWACLGKITTIGNGGPTSAMPDDICRRMDDSMTGPQAGILSRLTDADGAEAAQLALRAGMTCGWHIRGDRGDAAVRVGKALVQSVDSNDDAPKKEGKLLTLDAARWALVKGASFAAGNSVFQVEDVNDKLLSLICLKGPMKGRAVEIAANKCPFVFGRAHEADLCIMDRELSRKHGAIIFMQNSKRSGIKSNPGGSFILTDLSSTNGSFIRLVGPYGRMGHGALMIGDEFIVGRTGFSVNRFDYGISEAIGARPTMEDRTIVLQSLLYLDGKLGGEPKEDLQELAMTSFAAVFDGHGGDECSNFLVATLPRHIRSQMLAERESLRKAIESTYRNAPDHHAEDATSELMRRILRTAFLRTDKEFITPKTAPQSGSTAATVLLMGRRLFACNVGDSRVVLCRGGGQCVELTSDHKPSRPDEAARVRAAGGFILHKRVMGELAITRAFGDKSFKMGIKAMLEEEGDGQGNNIGSNDEQSKDLSAPLVSAEPEIASMVSKELFIGLLAVLHLRIPRSPHLLIFCTNLLRF